MLNGAQNRADTPNTDSSRVPIRHLQPASPELAKQPAEYVVAVGAQEEVDREVVGQTGSSDTIIVDAVYYELSHPLIDERRELDSQRLHHASRLSNESKVRPACLVTSHPNPPNF